MDVDGFIERLLSIDAEKRLVHGGDEQRVFVSAVAGVPREYPERPQTFGVGDDPAFERAFGVGAGCSDGETTAAPSVRTVDVTEAFDPWQYNVVSVCGPNWLPALACLPGAWWDDPRLLCLEVERLGEDRDVAGSCMLTETREGETRRLPECAKGPDVGVFVLPDGVGACVGWRTEEMSPACYELGLGAEAVILRLERSWNTLEYEVTCATEF